MNSHDIEPCAAGGRLVAGIRQAESMQGKGDSGKRDSGVLLLKGQTGAVAGRGTRVSAGYSMSMRHSQLGLGLHLPRLMIGVPSAPQPSLLVSSCLEVNGLRFLDDTLNGLRYLDACHARLPHLP